MPLYNDAGHEVTDPDEETEESLTTSVDTSVGHPNPTHRMDVLAFIQKGMKKHPKRLRGGRYEEE